METVPQPHRHDHTTTRRPASGAPVQDGHRLPPLYHATIAGLTGIAFTLGPAHYFVSAEDPQVYHVAAQAPLVYTARVEPQTAAWLAATILEPFFLALTPRRGI